jgi:ferritin-like metal-binding protein YciE
VKHLNRIYSAKAHLFTKLTELLSEVHFLDLKHAIQETIEDVGKQMIRMEVIYAIMDTICQNGTKKKLRDRIRHRGFLKSQLLWCLICDEVHFGLRETDRKRGNPPT